MFKYLIYRLAGAICPHVPDGAGYWLAARLGEIIFFLAGKSQRIYFYNLRRVLGEEASPTLINSVARRAFQNLVKNYFDLVRGHGLSADRIRAQLATVQGLEFVQDAIAQGKGVIAGSAHFGNWDMIIHLAPLYLDTEITVPSERLKPKQLNDYVLALRKSQGIRMVPLDLAPRAIIKALKCGQVVGLAYDRDLTRTGPVVNFFGKAAQMPDGAVQLALKYDVPVIIGFSVRQADNKSRIFIEPPLTFEKTGNLEFDICAGVQKIAQVMEKYIREYPDQWLMFQRIWDVQTSV